MKAVEELVDRSQDRCGIMAYIKGKKLMPWGEWW